MLSTIINILMGRPIGEPKSTSAVAGPMAAGKKAAQPLSVNGEEVPRYPPFVKGLPMIDPDVIVETQQELVHKIRHILALEPEEFEGLIYPFIRNIAAFVHLLPASEAHHHRGAGGLFRHSLEVGMWAAQFAEGRIFAFGKSPIDRKREEPRWVAATFIAGMLHDIGKAATDMVIMDPDGGAEWSPYIETMTDWGKRNKVERYFIRWRENRHQNHEQSGILLSNQVLPTELKAWLTQYNPDILRAMLEGSTCRGEHVVTNLVVRADSTSVEKDMKTAQMVGADISVGVPVERHVLDACRRLIANGTWTVNKNKSRIWISRDGIFVVWHKACEDILALLKEDKIMGIPRDPDTLADLLIERDLLLSNTSDDSSTPKRYWSIAPDMLVGRSGLVWLRCVKFSHAEILFSSEPPPPTILVIKGTPEEKAKEQQIDQLLQKTPEENEVDQAANREEAKKLAAQAGISINKSAKDSGESKSDSEGRKSAEAGADTPSQKPKPAPTEGGHNKPRIKPEDQVELPFETESSNSVPGDPNEVVSQTSSITAGSSPAHDPAFKMSEIQAYIKTKPGYGSDIFIQILDDLEQGKIDLGILYRGNRKGGFISYPGSFSGYGSAGEIMKSMNELGFIVPREDSPAMLVHDVDDFGKALKLNKELGDLFRELSDGFKNAVKKHDSQVLSGRNQNPSIPSKPSAAPAVVKDSGAATSQQKPSGQARPAKVPQRAIQNLNLIRESLHQSILAIATSRKESAKSAINAEGQTVIQVGAVQIWSKVVSELKVKGVDVNAEPVSLKDIVELLKDHPMIDHKQPRSNANHIWIIKK
jgi:hypothetical protein